MPIDELDDAAGEADKRRIESAEALRKQAAACRRIALQSRTSAGKKGIDALGDHFDEQAHKLDPSSLKR